MAAAGDGYAAREVLSHEGFRTRLTRAEQQALSAAVQSSGLGRGAIPADLMADLLSAVTMNEATISCAGHENSPAAMVTGASTAITRS
ncbi:hypothetical protein [Frankia sp. Cr2]|uniref:hypothetical protein n=1 Tax=Frankia sp. Cr2 TaxID=3073932 RepID=UPI002AD574C4|nr:hypothetical protein [Frankia sp. Cr2]